MACDGASSYSPCPSSFDNCNRHRTIAGRGFQGSFYLGPDTMSGPTLSPVSLLCFTCDPSHRGKVPDFQHLRDNQRRAARQKKGERRHCSLDYS